MSKGMLIKRANQKPTLQYLKSDMMIVIMNSWNMFAHQIMENTTQQGKWRERDFVDYDAEGVVDEKTQLFRSMCKEYEGNFRIAVCIAKNKPRSEWSPKPKRPDKPYKNFFEYVNKMKIALLERHEKYVFARKLQPGDVIPMYDGPYVVKEVFQADDNKNGYIIVYKEDMNDKLHTWKIDWGNNVPKFYGITRRVDINDNRRDIKEDYIINTVNETRDFYITVTVEDVQSIKPTFTIDTCTSFENYVAGASFNTTVVRLSLTDDEVVSFQDGLGISIDEIKEFLHQKINNDKVYTQWDYAKFKWNEIVGLVDITQFIEYCDGKLDAYIDDEDFVESNTPMPDWRLN